jgi:RNA polymerase sigma factor (TIGR02999 family)
MHAASSNSALPVGAPQGDLAETVYGHLRALAQLQMNSERVGHTLTATALVHEAFLRMENHPAAPGSSSSASQEMRLHFLRSAAEAMRRILIEHGRARSTLKRGGAGGDASDRPVRVPLECIGDVADLADPGQAEQIIAFDEVFRRLEAHDPRFADVVRLRFYGGFSVTDTANALGVSERTVNTDWLYARAWLARELKRSTNP